MCSHITVLNVFTHITILSVFTHHCLKCVYTHHYQNMSIVTLLCQDYFGFFFFFSFLFISFHFFFISGLLPHQWSSVWKGFTGISPWYGLSRKPLIHFGNLSPANVPIWYVPFLLSIIQYGPVHRNRNSYRNFVVVAAELSLRGLASTYLVQ